MLLKRIAIGLLSLCLISTSIPSEAGIFSKAAKGYVAAKAVQKVAPSIIKKISQNKAKKVAQNGVADSTKQLTKKQADKLAKKEKREKLAKGPLVDGELKVGKYKDVTIDRIRPANGVKNEEMALEAHHMPSKKYMKEHGVDTKDGISVDMLRARHKNTRTNGIKQ